jgi:hypothetical protein
MARFSDRMVPEVVHVFWAAMARGEFVTVAVAQRVPIGRRATGGWPLRVGSVRVVAEISRVAV